MAAGPGKYDDLATFVREKVQAKAVLIAVAGGNRGEGFSVQATDPGYLISLPQMLRAMADQIQADQLTLFKEIDPAVIDALSQGGSVRVSIKLRSGVRPASVVHLIHEIAPGAVNVYTEDTLLAGFTAQEMQMALPPLIALIERVELQQQPQPEKPPVTES